MRYLCLIFPWPNMKMLSKNSRKSWPEQLKHKKLAKRKAFLLARDVLAFRVFDLREGEVIELTITIFPPDNIKRDFDNVITAMKPSIDGVFDALGEGFDDSLLKSGHWKSGEVLGRKKGGHVVFEFEPVENKIASFSPFEAYLKNQIEV